MSYIRVSRATPSEGFLTFDSGDNTVSRRKVMICDDDQELLRLFQLVLEQTYDVLLVSSGKECLDKYTAERNKGNEIGVLLLDYRLGDMTGDDVACKIRKHNGTNTILMSAFELEKEVISKLKLRNCIVGMVTKPISIHELKKIVDLEMK
jgi:DNA-binding response OmpR family regulator